MRDDFGRKGNDKVNADVGGKGRNKSREETTYVSPVDVNQLEGKKLEANDVEREEGWLSQRKSRHRPGKREERWQPRDDDKPSVVQIDHEPTVSSGDPGSGAMTFTDDSVRDEAQTVLELDPDLRSYGLRIHVVKGEAQIHGVVDTLAEKVRAEEVVAKVPGVAKVANKISVSTDGRIRDEDVEFEVSEELVKEGVDTKHIGVKSSKGVVTLLGRTSDPNEIEKAKKAAYRARGVKDLVNKVKTEEDSI